MAYYIGVDGGGTKTAYALFNENKEMLHMVKTKGSNHENLEGSFEEAADIIMSGLEALVSEQNITLDDISGILMGLAGIDHQYQHDALYEILENRGLKNFRIYNDGFIVTKAGTPDGTGIGYNCGTGTCCNSIGSDGKMLQVGGFGELSGDLGNGPWIAQQTYQAVYDEICLKASETSMTAVVCEKFGINADRDGLLSVIASIEQENNDVIMFLIATFFDALNNGDASAMKICNRMALRGAQFIAAHVKQQKFDGEAVNVVLSGSIHTKLPSQVYTTALKAKAEELCGRELNFIMLDSAPVTGCINWLLENN